MAFQLTTNVCALLFITTSPYTYNNHTFLLTTALCGCMLKVCHLQIAAVFSNHSVPFH